MAGVTAMEDRVAGVTVRVVLPEILPKVAVMVVVPAARAVARPLLLTVATEVFDEVQVACGVRSRLVPSEYAPMATNFWVDPTGMDGDIDMEANVAEGEEEEECPHVVRDTAKDPRSNIAKTNLIFFMRTPPKRRIPPNLAQMVNAIPLLPEASSQP